MYKDTLAEPVATDIDILIVLRWQAIVAETQGTDMVYFVKTQDLHIEVDKKYLYK